MNKSKKRLLKMERVYNKTVHTITFEVIILSM